MLNIQEEGGITRTVEAAVRAVYELMPEANSWTRTEQPASKICLAMECGGSDGNSGVTANPALGVAADLLVAQGGTAFLGETTEIYGAEHLLTRRAVSREVGEKLVDRIKWWEWYTGVFGARIDNNPSPGNKAGGLTTIYEKSLGALAKAGSTRPGRRRALRRAGRQPGLGLHGHARLRPALHHRPDRRRRQRAGLHDGRGSVLGLKPTPCIKLATNTPMYERMIDDMDLDAGPDPRRRAGRERGPPALRHDPRRGQRHAHQERAAGGGRGGVRALDDRAHAVRPVDRGSVAGRPIVRPSSRRAMSSGSRSWRSRAGLAAWFLIVPLPNANNVESATADPPGLLLLKALPEVVPGRTFRESIAGPGHRRAEPRREPAPAAADRAGRRADRRGGDRPRTTSISADSGLRVA